MARSYTKTETRTEDMGTRMTPRQRELIVAAAARIGQKPAAFLRDSALRRAEQILQQESAYDAFEGFIGIIQNVPELMGREHKRQYVEALRAKYAPENRITAKSRES